MNKNNAKKLAKTLVKKEKFPSCLFAEFMKNGWNILLDEVYEQTAIYILENQGISKTKWEHLKHILPSIAFYKVLVKKEGSSEKALDFFGKNCFTKVIKIAKIIPLLLKIPGLYQKTPGIMKKLIVSKFGENAGFKFTEKECKNGFAIDMTKCPYFETCKKYDCPELTQFFCKSDDYCYGNMHPKLIWGRTKTLGTGGDVCDFRLEIRE